MRIPVLSISSRVALSYVVLAATWIVLSDSVVIWLFSDPQTIALVSTLKGWAFVAVTASLLFLQIRSYLNKLNDQARLLVEGEARFRTIFDSVNEAIFVHRCDDGAILDVNQRAQELFGFTREQIIQLGVGGISSGLLSYTQQDAVNWLKKAVAQGPQSFDWQARHKSGRVFWVDVNMNCTQLDGTEVILVAVRDAEVRKRIAQSLERKNAIYAVLSGTNKAIVTIQSRQELLDRVCQVALELAGFRLAWVAEVQAGEDQCLLPVAVCGEAGGFIAELVLSAKEDASHGQTPISIAAREHHHVVVNDLAHGTSPEFRDSMGRFGLHSLMAMPINGGGFQGVLTVVAGELNYFNVEIISLLLEVSDDVSFALGKIQQAQEQALAESRLRLHAQVFEDSRDGMLITDEQNRILMVNHAFTEMTGYCQDEVLGQNPRLLQSGHHDHDFYVQMWAAIRSAGSWQGEIWNRHKDGEVYPGWLTISAVRDDAGVPVNYFASLSDLSARKAQEEVQWLKHFDALTRLPNRMLLEDRTKEAILYAQQHGRSLALLSVNLNRFRYVNESLGHAAGDEVLHQVASKFSQSLGDRITVSRLSGDNFVILDPDLSRVADVVVTAEKILLLASESLLLETQEINLSASVGIALYPQDGNDFSTLLKCSDSALLQAREEGSNNYRFFTSDLNEPARRALSLSAELHQALEKGWFHLEYQAQVSVSSGEIVGVEALIRLQHPVRGKVYPSEFIPVAEETGLIIPLGAWVMHEACRQMRAWQQAGHEGLIMAVNLSPKQLRDSLLHETILHCLDETGLSPCQLELEFTESAVMHNLASTLELMRSLNQLGVRLSIDDFGTGYSSLSYLKQFPINRIKIDQSFVRGITQNVSDAAIVEAIIGLARALGLSTIAEGVETIEQATTLRVLHCGEYQGYLFARPMPAVDVEKLFGRKLW